MSSFDGIEDTLFIPLNGRIQVSKRFPEYFYDDKALELESEISGTALQQNTSEFNLLSSAARYHVMDAMMQRYIDAHDGCSVIILGCGLETAYFRLGRKKAHFYEIDLPKVIAGRREVLGENQGETLISGDLFDTSWTEEIDKTQPALIVVSGVFQYFKEEKIIAFMHELQKLFQDAELIFDAVDSAGLKYAKKYVKKTGNQSAMMYFSVDDCAQFAQNAGVTLLEWQPFFTDAKTMLKKKISLYTKIAMKITDRCGRLKVIRIKL